ncbi:MAG: chemotaxis protein CheW [bacterium]
MNTAQTTEIDRTISGSPENGGQYLTFILAGEEYGVDILRVQEIRGWERATRLPNTPTFVKGVINLRGTIVPIIDLRERFGLDSADYGRTTVVVVVKVERGEQSRVMGVVVDAVSDVYNLPENEIKETPDFGTALDAQFAKGLATVDKKMIILLDIDRLLNERELISLDAQTH